MMASDYYAVLGVANDASPAEIKKAYRSIARECHPDVAGDDEAKVSRFKQASDAYEVLSDEAAREKYDRKLARRGQRIRTGGSFRDAFYRRTADHQESEVHARNARSTARSRSRVSDPNNNLDLDDLFNDFGFGRQGRTKQTRARSQTGAPPRESREPSRPPMPQPGRDVHVDLDVPDHVAREGGTVTAVYYRMQRADSWRPGSPDAGVVRIQDIADIRLLPGTRNGEVLHEKGKGDAGAFGGPYGDLIVRLRVVASGPTPAAEPEPPAAEEPSDRVVDISIAEALLGGTVELDTPQGRVRLKVPPGTSSGARLRLKGKGVIGPGGKPVDLYVRLRIVVPSELDEESRRLIERFDELNPHARG
jgi:DnaJ-class molecular chaperone